MAIIQNAAGTFTLDIDSSGRALVALPTVPTSAGYAAMAILNGGVLVAPSSFGGLNRLAVGMQTLNMFDPIDGIVVNTNIWVTSVLTQAIAQTSAGFLILNSASSNAINGYAIINSIKRMQFINTFVPTARFMFKTPNVPQSNARIELGLADSAGVSGTTTVANGAYFQWRETGEFRCVITNASVDTYTVITAPTVNVTHKAHITFRSSGAEFWIDDVKVATVSMPAGDSGATSSSQIGVFARTYCGAVSPVTAPELWLSGVIMFRNDLATNQGWEDQMSSIGRGAYQSPVTTFLQTANWANVTVTTLATLSNTAASYATLGGQFLMTLPAGAAAAEYALFGYQVPTGWQLVTNMIAISSSLPLVHTATATMVQWAIATNSSGVSLATAEAPPTTWAPRRIGICSQTILATAAAGSPVNNGDVMRTFPTPIYTDSLRYFHVIVRIPNGVAGTASGFAGVVTHNGYFQ